MNYEFSCILFFVIAFVVTFLSVVVSAAMAEQMFAAPVFPMIFGFLVGGRFESKCRFGVVLIVLIC